MKCSLTKYTVDSRDYGSIDFLPNGATSVFSSWDIAQIGGSGFLVIQNRGLEVVYSEEGNDNITIRDLREGCGSFATFDIILHPEVEEAIAQNEAVNDDMRSEEGSLVTSINEGSHSAIIQ